MSHFFLSNIHKRPYSIYNMTTGSVLGEVGNDESMVFPTGIPVDIPVVLCSLGRYLVWYITKETKDNRNLFFGRN